MKKLQNTQGFTIIETSLVLAIAGLILVMAFVALPALQRQTRDAKRKEDAATFMQALTKYQENNRGQLPTYAFSSGIDMNNSLSVKDDEGFNTWSTSGIASKNWPKFYLDYLGNGFVDPESDKYIFMVVQCNEGAGTTQCTNDSSFDMGEENNIIGNDYNDRWADWFIFIGATCENGKAVKSYNNRNVAMFVVLENGSYCVDN